MDRVKTGIYGLDDLLEGGFPAKRNILISGSCGTGKSIFAMQYIFRGAAEYGEPGVFVTFDEMPEKIRQDMLRFGWDLKTLEAQEKLVLIDATSARAGMPSDEEHSILPGQIDVDKVLVELLTAARAIKAKRIAIDSIPAMSFQLEKESEIRRTILKLSYVLSRSNYTALMTTEIPEQSVGSGQNMTFSKYEAEEYIADGVILLNFLGIGASATRTLYVRKMRGTKHSLEIHPMEISDRGIVVRKIEDVFK